MKSKQEQSDHPDPRRRKARSGARSASRARWLIVVFLMALTISAAFSFLSQELLDAASLFGAFVVLLAIIAIGIFFDLVGVAVTAAEEKPFHSMASRKVPGGAEGIWLLRNAGKVSSVCNDVVGDICGIISGAAAAVIAVEAWNRRVDDPVDELVYEREKGKRMKVREIKQKMIIYNPQQSN